ncbi:MAG: alginate lyase family protein [Acidobacteriia bacterium]|nr:alginate lyase family protein [Terriglobia bacterium]
MTTPAGTDVSSSSFTVTPPSGGTGSSRGYVTTLGELATIAQKASQGIEPYKSAVLSIENFANTGSSAAQPSNPNPTFWLYGTISGSQSCSGTLSPSFLGNGAPVIEAKAMVYGLLLPTNPTLANQYAADIRTELLELSTTSGYGGTSYSGGNQCILNLAWYTPGWIIAADLIEDYPGWSDSDKHIFQTWLATVVYPKADWACDTRSNNWGAAGSVTSGMIADYLTGSGILMVDRTGATVNSHDAYLQAKKCQLDRMNGNSYMDNYNCHNPAVGFRADGAIPEELARGSTGCNGLWLVAEDVPGSWSYTQTHLQGTILHAEFLLRRGDASIYNNLMPTGGGSLQRAYKFILANPNPGGLSWNWNLPNEIAELEILYRHYRDSLLANQLKIGTSSRLIGGKSGQMLHFGTITHGFAVGENPGSPPTVAAP